MAGRREGGSRTRVKVIGSLLLHGQTWVGTTLRLFFFISSCSLSWRLFLLLAAIAWLFSDLYVHLGLVEQARHATLSDWFCGEIAAIAVWAGETLVDCLCGADILDGVIQLVWLLGHILYIDCRCLIVPSIAHVSVTSPIWVSSLWCRNEIGCLRRVIPGHFIEAFPLFWVLLTTLIDAYRAVPVASGSLGPVYLELLLCSLVKILQDLLICGLCKR